LSNVHLSPKKVLGLIVGLGLPVAVWAGWVLGDASRPRPPGGDGAIGDAPAATTAVTSPAADRNARRLPGRLGPNHAGPASTTPRERATPAPAESDPAPDPSPDGEPDPVPTATAEPEESPTAEPPPSPSEPPASPEASPTP
jgi:hypothetical protein